MSTTQTPDSASAVVDQIHTATSLVDQITEARLRCDACATEAVHYLLNGEVDYAITWAQKSAAFNAAVVRLSARLGTSK